MPSATFYYSPRCKPTHACPSQPEYTVPHHRSMQCPSHQRFYSSGVCRNSCSGCRNSPANRERRLLLPFFIHCMARESSRPKRNLVTPRDQAPAHRSVPHCREQDCTHSLPSAVYASFILYGYGMYACSCVLPARPRFTAEAVFATAWKTNFRLSGEQTGQQTEAKSTDIGEARTVGAHTNG